jgi:hypothetical protein
VVFFERVQTQRGPTMPESTDVQIQSTPTRWQVSGTKKWLISGVLSVSAVILGIVVRYAYADQKDQDARIESLDTYVHIKGTERDLFAAAVGAKLDRLAEIQQEMKQTDLDASAKLDRMNEKLDRVLMGQRSLSQK